VAESIQEDEGRFFVHPFEGLAVAMGTGTLGLEICEQCEDFDTLIVPVGGGGLIGGVANAVKQLRPECEVIGVEPEGADSMHRSFASGKPESIDKVKTIADSLGAPFAAPFSFGLCQQHVDRLTLVDDHQLRRAMGFLFSAMKVAVEPACAASTAALLGPLRGELQGKRVVLVFCGSNIDWQTFAAQAIISDVD
jgi:threonine dehydratase